MLHVSSSSSPLQHALNSDPILISPGFMDQILGLQTSGGVSDLGQRVAVISLGAPFGPSFGPPFGASHDGTERVRSTMISYLIHYPCRSVVFRDVLVIVVCWSARGAQDLLRTCSIYGLLLDPFMNHLTCTDPVSGPAGPGSDPSWRGLAS